MDQKEKYHNLIKITYKAKKKNIIKLKIYLKKIKDGTGL